MFTEDCVQNVLEVKAMIMYQQSFILIQVEQNCSLQVGWQLVHFVSCFKGFQCYSITYVVRWDLKNSLWRLDMKHQTWKTIQPLLEFSHSPLVLEWKILPLDKYLIFGPLVTGLYIFLQSLLNSGTQVSLLTGSLHWLIICRIIKLHQI